MNKLQLIAVAFVAAIATLTVAAAPSAQAADYTCENGFTGPDSKNMCVSEVEYTCTFDSNTNIVVVNDNSQNGFSGTAIVGSSTGGGSAVSGSVSNNNDTTFNFSVTNPGLDEVCVAKKVIPAIPPVVPTAPETPKVTAPQAEKPAVLAKTSGDKVFVYALAAAASLAVAAGVARIAVAAYARLKN